MALIDAPKEEYDNLKKKINFNNYRYHVLDDPIISDAEFDQLLVHLREIENAHPEWVQPDSPTQRAGSTASGRFAKIAHPAPVLSLANAFSIQEVVNWVDRVEKLDERVKYSDFILEPKIDGLTVVLTYHKGILVTGATRGDGIIGEDVTPNIRTIKSIPLAIPVLNDSLTAPETLVVRGEVFITNSDFERLNQDFANRGEKIGLNPRNTAAGSLRQLNSEVTAKRPLTIFTYQILASSDLRPPQTQWETLQYLKEMGFPVSSESMYCESREQMVEQLSQWEGIRDRLDYDIDGVVVKINDLRVSSALGFVGKDPRGSIALKFPAREATTILTDIGVNVGRTGVLTPYAILAPVEIGGVIVKQATLHNFDFIRERDIRVGDAVLIKRAGDVIPYVIGPIPERRDGSQQAYTAPGRCPSCGQPVEQFDNEVALYCVNNACPAQLIRNVEHFASRGAMDINGLGIKIVEQLINGGFISNISELYQLNKEQLLKLENFGEKKADNLLSAIRESRKQPLSRLIYGLGIHGVGEVIAATLSDHFMSLDQLREASETDLQVIEGIGPNVAQAIIDWFAQNTNQAVLEKLKEHGVWPENDKRIEEEDTESLPLAGMTIVVTGTLKNFSRDEIKSVIRKFGGKSTDSVSAKTTFVLVGENPGSKREKALEIGVPIYDEDKFIQMIHW